MNRLVAIIVVGMIIVLSAANGGGQALAHQTVTSDKSIEGETNGKSPASTPPMSEPEPVSTLVPGSQLKVFQLAWTRYCDDRKKVQHEHPELHLPDYSVSDFDFRFIRSSGTKAQPYETISVTVIPHLIVHHQKDGSFIGSNPGVCMSYAYRASNYEYLRGILYQ